MTQVIQGLSGLPSLGVAFSVDPPTASWTRRPKRYVCTRDTRPPASQVVANDNSSTMLIRLLRKRESIAVAGAKGGAKGKPAAAGGGAATPAGADEPAAKRQRTDGAGPSGGGAATAAAGSSVPPVPGRVYTEAELRGQSKPQLQELCRARQLLVGGNKTDLQNRLLDYQREKRRAAGADARPAA